MGSDVTMSNFSEVFRTKWRASPSHTMRVRAIMHYVVIFVGEGAGRWQEG